MLKHVIEWSIRNVFLVLLSTVFIVGWGIYALWRMPVDAIPDLSDVQVIIYTEYPGQAPQVVEDQVTYPLTTAMLAVPRAKVVRGQSAFGVSFIYVIFEDGTDIYWARSRVLEYLSFAANQLPQDVRPALGPDATGVGWIYQYVVTAKDRTLDELRTIQDWFLRYQLTTTHGISEIASVGGFVKTYQVTVDPRRLQAYDIPLKRITEVIAASNRDVGGRVIELAETEYMVRGRGYLKSISDLENLVVRAHIGMPVLLRDIARVELVPGERRGIIELNGEGEAVSGIAVARYGENALDVIHNLEAKIDQIKSGLSQDVSVESVYNRSELIHRAIATLREVFIEQIIIVALVCAVFLMHVRSALVAIIMLPIGVLIAFIAMAQLGINSNIMSLAGIALAIAEMTDAAIVMVENAHKHLARLKPGESRTDAVIAACQEVGPSLFFSLLIITVSFLPVFALEAQEGRMFQPLAYTKTFAMAGAAILSITLVPVLILLLIRGRIPREQDNPLGRLMIRCYQPIVAGVMQWKKSILMIALGVLAVTLYPAMRLGTEFMPTLNEGTLLYMPVTLPGISVTKAAETMQTQNKIIMSFPEVASVFGKAGRADTATDPAPLEMTETIINLKPEHEWRPGMTIDTLIAELDQALQIPGIANAWTMPIKNRIDMLATGIRTPVGIKVFGNNLTEIETIARQIEAVVKTVPGTTSAYAERITGGYYLDIEPDRLALARYGLAVGDLLEVISVALGGEVITTTVEGRERFDVAIRYPRELRSDPQAIATQVLVPALGGTMIPLGQLAQVKLMQGPPSIRTENALLSAYIFIDMRDRDIGGYIADAQQAVQAQVQFPPGYYATWSGQFEYMQRATEKLKIVIPLTVLMVFLLVYLNFGRLTETLIVMLSIPFSVVGGIWLMYWLDYNLSIAAVVGFIGLIGIAAESGMVMLTFIDQSLATIARQRKAMAEQVSLTDLYDAVVQGAVYRIRPVMMTIAGSVIGLLPVMLSTGTGSEIMRRIAAPMVGGMVSATILTLIIFPAVYAWVKEIPLRREAKARISV
ncbi:efflux RND transporter permease subunit [Nitrosomonas ureae]|uniref:Cu(I)/Ag(I) efflux system membrane protein CusA/SilA n=1 Tax=Nitrosomonas ureae TaxID=44577 RepID=A0A1H2DML4_9PROT|nr:CusA/CzcA family heavy metal efflux RND transporter [Nitrosomonas ureae]ALQ50702.1 cation transporter [Nitrosomonas ureae]SDT84163.1 Cu(I)/Ag(I) efflux system membrane protein CusA/SilA [Nitrosomonas ureae]